MGQASRRRRERREARAQQALGDVVSLRMAVFATPSGGPLALAPEVTLTKPAMLYADHVDLYSLTATTFFGTAHEIATQSPESLLELALMAHPADGMTSEQIREAYYRIDTIGRDPRAPREWREQRRKLRSELAARQTELLQTLDQQFIDSGGAPLIDALNAGALTISPILESPIEGDFKDVFIEAFLQRLAEVVSGDAAVYPLMTAHVHDLLESAVREGQIVVSDRTRKRVSNAHLATGLIDRLPTFPGADMSEILDIREELRGPLTRFRADVADLSSRVEAKPGTSDFANEVEDLWVSNVAPAIREIEERVHSDTYLRALTRVPDAPTAASSVLAGLGVTFGQAEGLIGLGATGAAGMFGAAAAAASPIALSALRDYREAKRRLPSMRFFFLHDVNQRLS